MQSKGVECDGLIQGEIVVAMIFGIVNFRHVQTCLVLTILELRVLFYMYTEGKLSLEIEV